MNMDRQLAIQYLRATHRSPWRWAESGEVLVWQDGSTIAFREEILKLLEWLAPHGLPSFGAVVFLLAAGRGKVCDVTDILTERKPPPGAGEAGLLLSAAREQLELQLRAALDELRRVGELPQELRTGIHARCVLAEAVFEPARAERHVSAAAVLRGLSEPIEDHELLVAEEGGGDGNCIRQIHVVAEGLKPHSAESLALRMRTGLDALPREIDVTLPSAQRARLLIDELSRDRELGVVARAARELTAAVRLPRRLAEREELAIAGVADITNRGPLDRLLLSELAHDDLILSVRVALNEALYLRREPPMREPPGTLALLLDSGLRLWGIPRVLATAVALALVARDRRRSEVRAWRAHGREIEPVDLLTPAGLRHHLGALETTAHPGEALAAFAATFAGGAQHQSILITHRDALEDSDFRQRLAAASDSLGFVAVVDRAGRFEMHALPLSRRPPVCEADLELAAVLEAGGGVPLIHAEANPDLPAIFGVMPFPVLLPVAGKLAAWTVAEDGYTCALMTDRRLVQFRNEQAGASVLASDLPRGTTVWMEVYDGTVHYVNAGAIQRPTRLISCRRDSGLTRSFDLATGSELLAVHRYGNVILLLQRHDVRAHSLEDGRMLGRILNPHVWVRGRFFRGTDQFYFAAWNGTELKFEPLSIQRGYKPSDVRLVFDRQGVEGPWLVHRSGMIVSTMGGHQYNVATSNAPFDAGGEVSVSRDGHRVCVQRTPQGSKLIDLRTGRAEHLLSNRPQPSLDPQPLLPHWNLHRVVEAVAKLPNGLAICGRKNQWRLIGLDSAGRLSIIPLPVPAANQFANQVSFGEERPVPGRGSSLQLAQWENGSCAWLDSRGLLHLRSHEQRIPEISLVLSSSEVAGWTSDGYTCGPGFFFERSPENRRSEPLVVFSHLQHFLEHL